LNFTRILVQLENFRIKVLWHNSRSDCAINITISTALNFTSVSAEARNATPGEGSEPELPLPLIKRRSLFQSVSPSANKSAQTRGTNFDETQNGRLTLKYVELFLFFNLGWFILNVALLDQKLNILHA
jgi:hypothetical protein